MTISLSTRAIFAAQEYTKQFMTLDKKGFSDSLAEEVTCTHSRVKNGFDCDMINLKGKADVVEAYTTHFFSITSNFDLHSEKYMAFDSDSEPKVKIKCKVEEDKEIDGTKRRYRMICRTQLDFKIDENGSLKVIRINERTSSEEIK